MKYVIIGNGIAGVNAVEAIRELDSEGTITMIAAEIYPPYCRPMISLVLEGAIAPDKLGIRSIGFYDDMRINPILGDRVIGIDVENQNVSTENGKVISFDKLLIATGGNPRSITAKKSNLKNIFFMRTEAQVLQMLETLSYAKKALVLGGGLVGFKAAYGLLSRGLEVTMAIHSGYPFSMQVDERAGEMILQELVKHGLNVKVGVDIAAFEGNDKVEFAHLSDDTDIPCDIVVIGKGVSPALSFVPTDHVRVDLGILVNQFMETSVPGIFAAGDVAQGVDVARKVPWINAIWPEAVAQGRIAGRNMAGRPIAYKGSLSRNVIRIFDLDVMAAGLVNPPSDPQYDIISINNPRQKTYRKLVFNGDRLVGAIMVNAIEQGGILFSLIHNETPIRIPREKLLEPSFNYRQLMI